MREECVAYMQGGYVKGGEGGAVGEGLTFGDQPTDNR